MIVDDSVSESSDECFTLELSDATETIDNPKIATVCITDDDGKWSYKCLLGHSICIFTKAYSVTVGLQQTAYTVTEVDDYQLVCFEVLSGDVDGRELVFDYSTASGTASKLMAIEVNSMFESRFLFSHKRLHSHNRKSHNN